MAAVTVCSTTKGLCLMFTLLSLVCLSSALNKDQLKQLKEYYQNMKQQMDRVKAEREEKVNFGSELLSEYLTIMDQLITLMKRSMKVLPAHFYEDVTLTESNKNYVAEIKAYIDRTNERLGQKIEEYEMNMREMKKVIERHEEKRAEL